LVIKTLDPDPDSFEMLDPDPDPVSVNPVQNTAFSTFFLPENQDTEPGTVFYTLLVPISENIQIRIRISDR
jgi:hypothetical protein